MAAVLASDVITLARAYINDPSANGRWSDASMIAFVNVAIQDLSRDVEWPQGRLAFYTTGTNQEYSLPMEIIKYYRVYVAGQLIVPTSIDTLEGRQYGLFDQGLPGYGVPETTPAAGSGGPVGNAGVMSPAWTVQQPAMYPVSNVWGLPAPDAQPWGVGQRPRYYTRGLAVIGLVPAPLTVVQVCIDGLFVQPAVTTDSSPINFPHNFIRAAAWSVVAQCAYADNNDRAAEQRQYAASRYEYEMKKLRIDLKRGDRQKRMPKLLTYRSFYQKGNNRSLLGPNYE